MNTVRGHGQRDLVRKTIYYQHRVWEHSSLETVHRVRSLAYTVRRSLLLCNGLAGLFPSAFASVLLSLSTFLRYYKLRQIERLC